MNPYNDIRLPNGRVIINFAEWCLVEARTADGRVFDLPIEFAGATESVPGLDQINVVLIPELAGAGAVQLKIVTAGVRGNTITVFMR